MGTALRAESYSGAGRHDAHRKKSVQAGYREGNTAWAVLVEEARGAGSTTKLTDIITKLNVNTKNGSGNMQSEHSRGRERKENQDQVATTT